MREHSQEEMGETDDRESLKKMVFVTVGTTCFDALVKVVDAQEVQEELSRKGYTHLLIQMGRGSYIPSMSSGEYGSLAVDYFTFSPSIADYMRSASLIISHAAQTPLGAKSAGIMPSPTDHAPCTKSVSPSMMENRCDTSWTFFPCSSDEMRL